MSENVQSINPLFKFEPIMLRADFLEFIPSSILSSHSSSSQFSIAILFPDEKYPPLKLIVSLMKYEF